MPKVWNKGLTKETSASLRKTSQTMKRKKLDNFSRWREQMKREGRIRATYPAFKKDGDLAEFIGVVLGDGHIQKFPRTERLLIFSHSKNTGFIKRYARMMEVFFEKKPKISLMKDVACIRISIYQKDIKKRLGIPYSPRKDKKIGIPGWIVKDREYTIRYLRGLYEAEGSLSHHEKTYTHKFSFSNHNQSLLKNVLKLLRVLGFSPHHDPKRVQLSRKAEVFRAVELLEFRKYS